MSRLMSHLVWIGISFFGVTQAVADIASPVQLKCTVKLVTPVGANFFGFGKGPVIGDTTALDLGGSEVPNLVFASGAQIGGTVTKHNLVKQTAAWEGMSLFSVKFKSTSNGRDYDARLLAQDAQNDKVKVSLDVLEQSVVGRFRLHSLVMDCSR